MAEVKKQNGKKIVDTIANVVVWIIIVFSVIVTVMAFSAQGSEDGVPELFGKSLISIQTPSMEPTYKVGDMVVLTKLSDEEKKSLKKDDIITYHAPIDINGDGVVGDINTHRIFEVSETGVIVTKGDGNNFNDSYRITRADIIGISDEKDNIPALGGVIAFLCSSVGFFFCVVLPLVLFFLFELFRFVSLIVSERAKKAPVSKETEEEIKRRAIEEYLREQEAAKAVEAAVATEAVEAPEATEVAEVTEAVEVPEVTEAPEASDTPAETSDDKE